MAAVALDQTVTTYTTTKCKVFLILKMEVAVFIDTHWMQCTNYAKHFNDMVGLLIYSPIWGCN